jgi:ribosomal protein S18 acetylase RimI-like enzyme
MISVKEVRTKIEAFTQRINKGFGVKTSLFIQNINKKVSVRSRLFFEKYKQLRLSIKLGVADVNKRLQLKFEPLFKFLNKKFHSIISLPIKKFKIFFSKHHHNLIFLSFILSILSKVYKATVFAVSKICEFLAFLISRAATSVHLLAFKIDILSRYMRRRIYVRKTLAIRNQWYVNKKGNFYNPKIKVTVYPTWECTWNIERVNDHHHGYESKKQAQEVAFKMWMKNRLLQKRLEKNCFDAKIPINLTQKILSNKIVIRKPVFQDITHLLALMEQVGHFQEGESMQMRIQAYSNKPHCQILLAERGKKIVGFIAFVLYDLFMSEGKRCHIEGLVVDVKERGLSVKRKLMQAAEDFARENKGAVVDLTADLEHIKDGMRDFYKILGYNNEGAMAKAYLRKELL